MSIKIQIASPDLAKQISLLRQYPQIAGKHFRPAVSQSMKTVAAQVKPRIPRKTGLALSTFGTKMQARGLSASNTGGGYINIIGRVGWFDAGDPWYVNVVEHGAAEHEMNTYVPRLGVYIRTHPGFSAVGFMKSGYEAAKSTVESLLSAANDAVLQELKT